MTQKIEQTTLESIDVQDIRAMQITPRGLETTIQVRYIQRSDKESRLDSATVDPGAQTLQALRQILKQDVLPKLNQDLGFPEE